jgi:hypothetical protein
MKITIIDLRYSVNATNENLAKIKSEIFFRLSSSLGVQSLHERGNLACMGTVSECHRFLKGVNYALNMPKPLVYTSEVLEFREHDTPIGDRGK